MGNNTDFQQHWHAIDTEAAIESADSSQSGLTQSQARERQQRFGKNRLRPPQRRSALRRMLAQFNNVLIHVLLVAALGTALLGHWLDTWVILGVVIINALIGFVQEGKAEKALDSIRSMLVLRALVSRDGKREELDASELVPGDVVHLKAGDRVPADLRLLQVRELRVDQALLTGESEPDDKQADAVDEDCALADQACMAWSGTMVVAGRARGLVVATGDHSEIGRIGQMLTDVQTTSTPLLLKVAGFGRWLSLGIVVLALLTFAVGLLLRDYPFAEMFLAAVSLAVAAIPEGLPAILTITLAIGVQRMAARNAIVRRLPAVETLGSVTVICSDKTGTLTRNEMTARQLVMVDGAMEVTGVGYRPTGEFRVDDKPVEPEDDACARALLLAGLLCNEAQLQEASGDWQLQGDPTEGALLVVAAKAGLDPETERGRWPRVDAIPFDSRNKYMASLHHDHSGQGLLVLKGAPEQVLARCDTAMSADGPVELDQEHWHRQIERLADSGHRVLGVAQRQVDAEKRNLNTEDVDGGLCLMGLVGIIDPPRDEAIDSVKICQRVGVTVKMITGDHAGTALAVARQLAIAGEDDQVLTGRELDAMDDEALGRAVLQVNVFARTTPEHKLRLVSALQAAGEVVAMTGDGVNDAPALKRADVGVAMGQKGTEAAREAAEIVLADDNFASIANAVEEGRTVYDNIRKAILYLLPTNAGQAMAIMMAIFLGMALPLTPVQVLWVNMVVAVTLAMALAFEPTEPDTMKRPPRAPGAPLLDRFMLWRIPFVAVLLWIGTMGAFLLVTQAGESVEMARTAAINSLVFAQMFYLFNARHVTQSVLNWTGIFGNRVAWMGVAALLLLQSGFTYLPPMQALFGTVALPWHYWLAIGGFGVVLMLLVEVEKSLVRRIRQRRGKHAL